MDNKKTAEFVNGMWDDEIIPQISEYIKIPNKSPHFDPDWDQHGHMETAVQMLEAWCKTQPVKGMTVEIVRIEGRTPILFCDIPGDSDEVVLLYGHYDKQPEFSGWDDPTKTVVDFFLQPRIRVPPKYLNIMENTVASTISMDILRPRAHALAAILHLKWVTIVLAVLKPTRLGTMLAVDVSQSKETLIKERLARADELLSEGVPVGLS